MSQQKETIHQIVLFFVRHHKLYTHLEKRLSRVSLLNVALITFLTKGLSCSDPDQPLLYKYLFSLPFSLFPTHLPNSIDFLIFLIFSNSFDSQSTDALVWLPIQTRVCLLKNYPTVPSTLLRHIRRMIDNLLKWETWPPLRWKTYLSSTIRQIDHLTQAPQKSLSRQTCWPSI